MDALKILSSLMNVNEYMALFIKVLVHVEFHLYFSKIKIKKSVQYTRYTYIMFIFRSLSQQLRSILGYTEVEILCALRLDVVVLRTVEVRDCPEELAGHKVLINMAVPCILKAQFQLCGDGWDSLLNYLYAPL